MKEAFKMLREIKSVVFSTVNNGYPAARIIDLMYYDESGLYFISLNTKPFYKQLINNGKVAITGLTKDYIQIRIVGDVKELNKEGLDRVYKENPEFENLFPKNEEQGTMSVFQVYKGIGEVFDLSGKINKMNRRRFAFGGETVNEAGLKITDKCIACGKCEKKCPFNAIEEGKPYYINPRLCDECGICYSVCPVGAILQPKGM